MSDLVAWAFVSNAACLIISLLNIRIDVPKHMYRIGEHRAAAREQRVRGSESTPGMADYGLNYMDRTFNELTAKYFVQPQSGREEDFSWELALKALQLKRREVEFISRQMVASELRREESSAGRRFAERPLARPRPTGASSKPRRGGRAAADHPAGLTTTAGHMS